MKTKVSVIIPVYNAESYLTSCIESLLGQSLQECEYIFINDGSTDKSTQLIKEFKKIDHRIKLINQQNQGVSIARNNGLKIACGEYLGFVDADDFIDKNMFEILYTKITQANCDVVVTNFESEIDSHKIITRYPFPVDINLGKDFIRSEILPFFIKTDSLNSVCNKIYRNKTIKDNNILFPVGMPLGEDGIFNIKLFSCVSSMRYIDYVGYHYRNVEGSATRNINNHDYFNRALEVYHSNVFDNIYAVIGKDYTEKLKSIKLIKSVMSYIHVYFKPTKEVSFKKRYKYIKNMINNKDVIKSLPVYYKENIDQSNAYEKLIIILLGRRSLLGLFCATKYSRIRNKQ